MREVKTETTISAPAGRVWEALLDSDHLSEWNPFIHRLEGEVTTGGRGKVVFTVDGKRTFKVPVRYERVEANVELRWTGGLGPLMKGSHYFRLSEGAPGQCKLEHGEVFEGLLVPLFWPLLEKRIATTYEAVTRAVKARCE